MGNKKPVRPFGAVFDSEIAATINRLRLLTQAPNREQVIRRAIGFYEWGVEQHLAGRQVGSFKDGEPVRTVKVVKTGDDE